MESNLYSPELVAELTEWLEPVGKGTLSFIAELQTWAEKNKDITPRINVYYCKNKHETVTKDRDEMSAEMTIVCPMCQAEARSTFYACDQSLTPTHEFFRPKNLHAFPKAQRAALANGAFVFTKVFGKEPEKLSTRIKPSL